MFASLSVAVIILFMTMSISMTLLILMNVLLVNIFMLGIISFWGVKFNFLASIHLSFAIGVAVDYSSHVAHAYTMVEAPKRYLNMRKRAYKAKRALSSMGTSVFHGGFSTLLVVLVLSQAEFFIFVVLFKCWVTFIVFGLLNGLVLLPVLLSLIGPLGS